MKKKTMLATLAVALVSHEGIAQTPRLGVDPIDKVIEAMTLDEKLSLLVGSEGNRQSDAKVTVGNSSALVPGAAGELNAIPRLGIPSTVLADGPAGLRIDSIRKDLTVLSTVPISPSPQ